MITKMREDPDKKHRRVGWITSITTQLLLLALFYFLIVWKEPFPPIPSYGIELSFGIEDQGSGIQPVSNPDPVEKVQESEEPSDETVEEMPVEEQMAEETESETAEEPVMETSSADLVQPEQTEPTTQPKEDPVKKAEDKPKLNPEAIMPTAFKSDKTNDSKGTMDEKGSEGKQEGTIDGRALMGQQGVPDGANLNMTGWKWEFPPKPKDDSPESGKIVYEVTIDDDGYVKKIVTKSSTVSPTVEIYYRQSIDRIRFIQTTNTPAPPTSTGTITFIIRSK